MDKTFDEAIAGIRKAERGVEVREDIAQGMEHVAKISEACEKQAALATSSAATAQSAASTSTAKADEATRQAKQAKADREKAQAAASTAASDVTDLLKGYTDSALASKEAATASQTAAKASANAAQGHQTGAEAAQKKAEDAADRAAAIVSTDKTLTVENAPADAKAVGEALKNLNIRPATSTALGVIKVGSGLSVTDDGMLSADAQKYTLPAATATTLGGVKVGSGLSVTDDGMLSADAQKYTLPAATATTLGGVKVGSGLTVDADGTLHLEGGTAPDPYPVGSIFQTVSSTSPAALFGGTWEQIASERVLMGASSSHKAGTTVKAGLPNITGTANGGVLSVSTPQSNGAFGATHYDSSLPYLSGDARRLSTYDRTFDASRSNPIYGASDTVQPAAYYVHYWQRKA